MSNRLLSTTERGRAGYDKYRHEFAKLIWQLASPKWNFDDVTFDLISVQYFSLKGGHDYGQYVRDAKNAGMDEVASFFEEVMAQDSERARRCHDFLAQIQRAPA